ncbi:MAG: CHAP domain-containing protein [Bacilli bacterium]|nr:CHAP domain-containing protein [Bacilli bacterium]
MKKLLFVFLLALVLIGCNQTNTNETFLVFDHEVRLHENEGIFIPISYTGIDEDRFIVTFSNSEILEFDEETLFIKAKKLGYTKIDLQVKDSEYNASFDVYVEAKNVIAPVLQTSNRDMNLKNPFKLYIANQDKLGAAADSFIFTLSDETLAEIDDDLTIHPKAPGKLTITATYKFNEEITSNFEVNIVDNDFDEKLIITTKDNLFTVYPGDYLELFIDGERVNMENYIYSSYNMDYASITSDGKIIGIKDGLGYFGVKSKTTGKSGVIYIEVKGEENNVNYIERLINIALAEKGYKEGQYGWTKFGEWYKQGYENLDWCAMFVAWSSNEAGIPTTIIPRLAKVEFMKNYYERIGRFEFSNSGYIPNRGDIIMFGDTSHVGIVTYVQNGRVHTIEGNTSNTVAERSYALDDTYVLGYGIPDYNKLNY